MNAQSFHIGDIVMVRGGTFRIMGFRPVGGMQGLMLLGEPACEDAGGQIEFVRISDAGACTSLASVA